MATISSKTTTMTSTRKFSSTTSSTVTNTIQATSKMEMNNTSKEITTKIQNSTNSIQSEAKTNQNELQNGTKSEETSVKKTKTKKIKKAGELKQKPSVKLSSHKFEELQKRNSSSNLSTQRQDETSKEAKQNCRLCDKIVYKMEEIKAEHSIWHNYCFKCDQCGKQLNVDNYQSHEGVLYCKPHHKLLFAPKAVQNDEPEKPKKPMLIICENQPEELPSDVVRASDKVDLGLEELQKLNVKSRFELFEKGATETKETVREPVQRTPSSAKILKKLTKFEQKPVKVELSDDEDEEDEEASDVSEDEDDDEGVADIIRSNKRRREKPLYASNMSDIKSKFESGHIMTKEERREERKQEIQSIRSRLFMGKQARIKEMYQQAVEESQQSKTASSPKIDVEVGEKMKNIAEKFEKGEVFHHDDEEQVNHNRTKANEDMAIFEQGLGKQSRNLFKELDATAVKEGPQQPQSPRAERWSRVNSFVDEKQKVVNEEEVVKHDESRDDVKIDTSDIISKFKFFETYKPAEKEKRQFRITPPRDGVVKLPTPDQDENQPPSDHRVTNGKLGDTTIASECHTATKMLSVFKQLEENQQQHTQEDINPRPLKRFTPPRDENKRVYSDQEDRELSDTEEYEEEEEEEMGEEEEDELYKRNQTRAVDDEFLKQAQSAARAKQLRAKFEKWEQSEIEREKANPTIYEVYDEGQTESTRSLRAKFESMREAKRVSGQPKIQVHRFV